MQRLTSCTAAILSLLTAAPAAAVVTLTYEYDSQNRLRSVVRSDGPTISYLYDEIGNITTRTAVAGGTAAGATDTAAAPVISGMAAKQDTDGDGIADALELAKGLDPNRPDTDGDGSNDAAEIHNGSDPTDPRSIPVAGDLDGDSTLTRADVLLGQRILSGEVQPSVEQLRRGDVAPLVEGKPAPNGEFNLADVLVLEKQLAGEINF